MSKKTLLISPLGGAGIGKSTFSKTLEIYFDLYTDFTTHFVGEFAQELILLNREEELLNQIYVTGTQMNRLLSFVKKVDILITDSHPILGLAYGKYNKVSNGVIEALDIQIKKLFLENEDIEHKFIFLKRDDSYNYNMNKRIHTKDESIIIDNIIEDILVSKNIKFDTYKISDLRKSFDNTIKKALVDLFPNFFIKLKDDNSYKTFSFSLK